MRKLAGILLFIWLVAIGGIAGLLSGCQPNAAQPLDRYAGHLPLEDGQKGGLDVLQDAEVKRLMRETVPEPWRNAAYRELTSVYANEIVGGWLLVHGCLPVDCFWKSYTLALRLDNPAIAFFGLETIEKEPRTFSVQCFSSETMDVRRLSPEFKNALRIRSPNPLPWIDSLSCPGNYSAPMPDPAAADNPFDAWRQCPTTAGEISERLDAMSELADQFYYLPVEERLRLTRTPGWPSVFLLHVESWTLPERSGTSDSGECYAWFREAKEALASQHWKRAHDSAGVWESCIGSLYGEVPQEVREIASCIKSVHAPGTR